MWGSCFPRLNPRSPHPLSWGVGRERVIDQLMVPGSPGSAALLPLRGGGEAAVSKCEVATSWQAGPSQEPLAAWGKVRKFTFLCKSGRGALVQAAPPPPLHPLASTRPGFPFSSWLGTGAGTAHPLLTKGKARANQSRGSVLTHHVEENQLCGQPGERSTPAQVCLPAGRLFYPAAGQRTSILSRDSKADQPGKERGA